MRSCISTTRLITAAVLLAGLPLGAAAAQSCLGFPLQPNQKSLALTADERGDLGGAGATFSMVSKANLSLSARLTQHEIDAGGGEGPKFYNWSAEAARPVFRDQTWGTNKSGNGGTCFIAEFGGMSSDAFSSTFVGAGLAYGLQISRFAIFAAPIIGMAGTSEVTDTYMNVKAGASARLGPIFVGFETTAPLQPEGALGWSTIHIGAAFGKATAIPATPVKTTSAGGSIAQVATQPGTASPAAPATGPTAGLKPYAIDDIEAMVKNSVAATRIVELSRRACLSFRVDDAAETRLRRVGAEPELLTGLRQSCYSAS